MSQSGVLRISGGGGGGGALNTLKGDSGGFVGPDGFGNINIIGDGVTVNVAGNAGTNTLTISASADIAIDFLADDGNTATPALNTLKIFGSTNINTEAPGSSDQIKINLNDSILLPTTTAANSGVIALGGNLTTNRFIHNFGTANTFIGTASGNFTTTAQQSVGVGTNTLNKLTSGNFNCAVGDRALDNITSGVSNIAYGGQSGTNYTTESSNIVINNPGVVTDANTIRIGFQGAGPSQQDKTYIAGIYNTAFGATNQVVFVDNQGKLGSSKGNDGQIIIGSTAGSPAWANLTSSDSSITITNGPNTIDLIVPFAPVSYSVTTNNDTPTAIATISLLALPADAVTMEALVVAKKDDVSASFWGRALGGARISAGNAVLVESPQSSKGDDSPDVLNPRITIGVSGPNIILYVIGVAAETWYWEASVKILFI